MVHQPEGGFPIMTLFQVIAVLLVLAALLSYANHVWLKLPTTIGLMLLALLLSLFLMGLATFVPQVQIVAQLVREQIDFDKALMHGMLGYLLFAGALHVDLGDLARQKLIVAILATIGVVFSTCLIGVISWLMLKQIGLHVNLIHCFLFGALISPTDPIAVLALLKNTAAPRSLSTKIAGESLFNDGVGIVIFLALLEVAGLGRGHDVTAGAVGILFAQEAIGGLVFGLIIGYIAYRMLKSVDQHQVEILVSVALVTGGYALADALHVSGPIAMVVAGLLIGNHGRLLAMSEATRDRLDTFWELIDEILNAVLFVLIGLELLVLTFKGQYLIAAMLAIPMVLMARFIAVGLGVSVMRKVRSFTPHAVKLMTWGGLRGGISVAMALYLEGQLAVEHQTVGELILVMTYVVVAFSIIIQGLTMGPLTRRWLGAT